MPSSFSFYGGTHGATKNGHYHCVVGGGLYHLNQSIAPPSFLFLGLRWAEEGARHPAVQSRGFQDVRRNCDIQQDFLVMQGAPRSIRCSQYQLLSRDNFELQFWSLAPEVCLSFVLGSRFCHKPGSKCWAVRDLVRKKAVTESEMELLGTPMWWDYKHLTQEWDFMYLCILNTGSVMFNISQSNIPRGNSMRYAHLN